MVELLYNWISSIDLFLVMFFIIKYIFLKLCDIDRKSFIKMMIMVVIFEFIFEAGGLFYKPISPLGMLTIFIFIILKYEKKHKIRSLFIIFPTMIVVLNLLTLFMIIGYITTGSFDSLTNDNNYYSAIIDVICWSGILVFAFKGKNFRTTYDEVIKNRTLDNYEKVLLSIVLIISFAIMCVMFSIDELDLSIAIKKGYMLFTLVVNITLDLCIIGMVTQRNKKFYYQTLSGINEYYLKTQIEHFKNYQNQQRETRRIKHDMKNHMILLKNLAESGKLEEVKKYISNLTDDIFEIDNEIHTGNEITDAIINEKSCEAKNKGIKINVDGLLSNNIKVSPIDLCTIFSNALDNAIEYIEKSHVEDKNIYVNITSNNSIYMITFKNKVSNINNDFISKKKDKVNHGFGIENMRRSVEKYNGEIKYRITDDYILILEIMLFQ